MNTIHPIVKQSARAGFVYFALAENGLCKIGKSRDPEKRLANLQAQAKMRIALYHKIATNNGPGLEAKFHRFFAAARVIGEWFALGPKELSAILKMQRHDMLAIDGRSFDEPVSVGSITASAKVLGRLGGLKGGGVRKSRLTPERRQEIARMGGMARQAKMAQPGPGAEPTEVRLP